MQEGTTIPSDAFRPSAFLPYKDLHVLERLPSNPRNFN
jgi:hypothetical protein